MTQRPINWWMDKRIVVYSYSEILLYEYKKGRTYTTAEMFQNNDSKWKNPGIKVVHTVLSIYIK